MIRLAAKKLFEFLAQRPRITAAHNDTMTDLLILSKETQYRTHRGTEKITDLHSAKQDPFETHDKFKT